MTQKTRRLLAVYIVWVMINFVTLMFVSRDWNDIDSDIFPFNDDDAKYSYDISEFLVYTIIPLGLYFVCKLLNGNKNYNNDEITNNSTTNDSKENNTEFKPII